MCVHFVAHKGIISHIMWADKNDMTINTNKTKELVIGPWGRYNLTPLQTDQGTVERVYEFKLLGVHIDSTLTWTKHIDYITKKATKRLYFLKVGYLNVRVYRLITSFTITPLSFALFLSKLTVPASGITTFLTNCHYRLKVYKNVPN